MGRLASYGWEGGVKRRECLRSRCPFFANIVIDAPIAGKYRKVRQGHARFAKKTRHSKNTLTRPRRYWRFAEYSDTTLPMLSFRAKFRRPIRMVKHSRGTCCSEVEQSRFLDFAGSSANADDPASLEMTTDGNVTYSAILNKCRISDLT